MKSVQFDENNLDNIQEIAKALFEDENDPRSRTYKRILIRPKINWLKPVLWLAVPVLFIVLFSIAADMAKSGFLFKSIIIVAVLLGYLILTAKKSVIFAVEVYQHYAPDSLRKKCRFEPSCSDYMILSIKKYGLFMGVFNGIKRLKRCDINHGGYDYP